MIQKLNEKDEIPDSYNQSYNPKESEVKLATISMHKMKNEMHDNDRWGAKSMVSNFEYN
jgi:hypothetical protein